MSASFPSSWESFSKSSFAALALDPNSKGLYVKSHYLEFEEETDEEIEQDIADDPEDHNDNIPYAEESDFEDDTIYTEERKPIPKIIPKKKKAPFNVEAFAKECNAYVVKQERQEEQENLQH